MGLSKFLEAVQLAQRHVDKLRVWASTFGGKVLGGCFKAHICLAEKGLIESIMGGLFVQLLCQVVKRDGANPIARRSARDRAYAQRVNVTDASQRHAKLLVPVKPSWRDRVCLASAARA